MSAVALDSMKKLAHFWSIKAFKSILVVTQNEIMNLKISRICLL